MKEFIVATGPGGRLPAGQASETVADRKQLTFTDSRGQPYALDTFCMHSATVLLLPDTGCPVSQKYGLPSGSCIGVQRPRRGVVGRLYASSRYRQVITESYPEAALEAYLKKETIAIPQTQATGCFIEPQKIEKMQSTPELHNTDC